MTAVTLNATAAERFWPKVDMSDPDGCWPWTARCDEDGYGRFRPDGTNTGDVGAHRVAFVLAGGTLEEGECVLHRCDNPPCVRPSHLFAGTTADNNRDKAAKGRAWRGGGGKPWKDDHPKRVNPELCAKGEANGHARLTEDLVREIRKAHADGESQGSIGRRLGIPQPHISRIVLRRSWAHVD